MQLNSKNLLVQLKVLIFYLLIFRIAFRPAIKNSNVETIMTGARTATITDPSTTIFTEGAHISPRVACMTLKPLLFSYTLAMMIYFTIISG